MEDLSSRIEDLVIQGYNCSQIMMMLVQEMRDSDNPELISAMDGLSGGMWARRTCGCLTGGCCLLASYGAVAAGEMPKFPYKETSKNFVLWFEEKYGTVECKDLVSESKKDRFEVCPGIVEACFTKCMELLEMMDVDVYE